MDDISTSALFIILGVLVLLSGYFSSSETGIMSINRYRLRHLVKEKHKSAQRVDELLKRPDRLIGLILIGNNLVNIAASAVATVLGMRLLGDAGIVVATFALTLVILIFAEVTPKTLAALYPEKIAFPSSVILKLLLKILFPVVVTVNWITNGMLKLIGVSPEQIEEHSLSKEELKTVLNESGAMLPTNHQDMMTSILDLDHVTVEDIMIPRNEINAIDINDDWKDISKQLTNAQHTRVLLYRDQIDDAVGFIHSRDALRLLTKEQFDKPSLLRAVREIYYIPESTSLNTQLLKFQQNKERIGLVVDEYGDIQGLVTLEDILEEVVGDFTTTKTPAPSDEVDVQNDGSVMVDGGANVRDLNKEMRWHLPTEGPKTLSGLIVEHLEDIPQTQLGLKIAGYPMEVVEIKENMIKVVKVYPHKKKKSVKPH
ncbi:HlyC/CorC family transporter [Pseudoalteromonas rubra]|uniref:Magnesium and cobalt efflux protein CorC n=1 Tax=Pseudoalteromonas rubra TaxID=43658 RepID=A0A4Q7ELK7_9GAMM|nr:HlyC/CorC family transporter [Pseudoalteromonas rubra]RZM85218.1 magnesium/cobalt efflux protein [Pseudoalteromonas rubra]